MECIYCGRICKNKNSLTQHEIRCKSNPNRIVPKKAYYNAMRAKRGSTGANQHTKAKERGEVYIVKDSTRAKLSAAGKGKVWSDERKAKHSLLMRKIVLENPKSYSSNNVCGRVKIIEYNGSKLKGSWELKVAKHLDEMNIKWESEANPQTYFWNDGWHLYFPDFYLPEYNMYIEVKGYKRERDEAKWKYFADDLVIIDSAIIKSLGDYNSIEKLRTLLYKE